MVLEDQNNQPLLSRRQAAQFLGLKESTLAVWQATGRYSLPVIKVGRVARYRMRDLEKFLNQRTVFHSSNDENKA
jgi:predicted site-specific integrase-resolvase